MDSALTDLREQQAQEGTVLLDFSGVPEVLIDFSPAVSSQERPKLEGEQKEARDHPGNTLVTAVYGAGKTEVLIQRHERNEERKIKSLSLTFTIAAASEIKRRIPFAEAYTIHSFCYHQCSWNGEFPKLLRDYILSSNKEEFDEVLVDEVQNLTPLMLDAISAIPKKSLFAVGDPLQSCYTGEWTRNVWDAPALGPKAFEYLADNCTEKVIHGNRRSNQHVVDLLEGLSKRGCVALGPKHFDTSLVVARTHRELNGISDGLLAGDVPHTIFKKRTARDTKYETFGAHPKVDLMVYHQCVGTEYKRVFLFDWNGADDEDMHLLRTATARAAEEVYTVERGFGLCALHPRDIEIPFERMTSILRGE